MRDLQVPEKGPKRKLLDATERLVLEKGFDLVSVRDITGVAKANVAAVHYHFGSREGLLALVVQHVMVPLNAERMRFLDAPGSKLGTEELVGGYVRSLFAAAESIGMDLIPYLKLVGRILVFPDGILNQEISRQSGDVCQRYVEALAGSMLKRRVDELETSWRFFDMGLSQALIRLADGEDAAALMKHWIDFGTRLVGQAKDGGKAKKTDGQGMLFDF